jgi:uncharacterized protein (UPF0276 family)
VAVAVHLVAQAQVVQVEVIVVATAVAVAAVAEVVRKVQTKVGLGFRHQLKSDIFFYQNKIDILEIITDHYLDATNAKLEELKVLHQHFSLAPHCLDLSLGSAEGIEESYLEKVAELLETIESEWFSDHICFTKSGGRKIGHLAPVPYTREALEVFRRNIKQVKSVIKTPLILENITYMVQFPSSEMSESEFIKRLCDENDCGILLDVTNLYINSVNFQFDWRKWLDNMPLERVVQLHFVGGHKQKNWLIDSHAHQTPNEIWEVYREVCQRCNVRAAILERDDNFPKFTEIIEELETARSFSKSINSLKAIV